MEMNAKIRLNTKVQHIAKRQNKTITEYPNPNDPFLILVVFGKFNGRFNQKIPTNSPVERGIKKQKPNCVAYSTDKSIGFAKKIGGIKKLITGTPIAISNRSSNPN